MTKKKIRQTATEILILTRQQRTKPDDQIIDMIAVVIERNMKEKSTDSIKHISPIFGGSV